MSVSSLSVRPYRDSDWPRLQAIHDAARRSELALAGLSAAFLPLEVAAPREGLFDYTLAVAELEGAVAGFAAYTQEELAWLYVDPPLARRGVGRALVEHALGEMGRPASIEVLAGNAPALALYQRLGFRQVETVRGKMPGNEAFPVTVHVLTLDAPRKPSPPQPDIKR